jgi:hypothetical protein
MIWRLSRSLDLDVLEGWAFRFWCFCVFIPHSVFIKLIRLLFMTSLHTICPIVFSSDCRVPRASQKCWILSSRELKLDHSDLFFARLGGS